MKSRAMTHRVFFQVFLLSTMWLAALTTSDASATALDVSADEVLAFERSEKMGHKLRATSATAPEHEIQPANPNASDDAKKVLSYIVSLPDRLENRVISGQHLSGGWYDQEYGIETLRSYQEHVVALYDSTGKWPAMLGADYGNGMQYDPYSGLTKPEKISIVNRLLIDHWNKGGLVAVDHIADNPWTEGEAWDLSHRNLKGNRSGGIEVVNRQIW